MHATRPCSQTCGGRGVSLHGARPCIQIGRGRGVTLHVSRSCNQPCGARDQFTISPDVGLLEKVEKGFGSQKSGLGSRPRSTKNNNIAKLWIVKYSGISLYARVWNVFDCVICEHVWGGLVFPRPRIQRVQGNPLFAGSGRLRETGSCPRAEYGTTV
ncbi:hypothetical protein F2Q68_00039913 [Brassica cretica]|uniref:Uncharacterized protein n=1 Tax=Brassica cretica TaxID=69181 RepID=A0A8S9M9R6_BRACR|nr:hypothetical protein F2Q68_00039913 [Brassica cretica]